jgi:hypothetical protein
VRKETGRRRREEREKKRMEKGKIGEKERFFFKLGNF